MSQVGSGDVANRVNTTAGVASHVNALGTVGGSGVVDQYTGLTPSGAFIITLSGEFITTDSGDYLVTN